MLRRLHIKELYGFSGKLGTGKNFIAEKLFLSMLPRKPTMVMAFADQIKADCCVKDKIAFNRVFHKKDEESRRVLQTRGTEEGRDKYGYNHWINYLETWIRIYQERGIERFIITDLRFPNELEWVKKHGGYAIRIEAPQRNLKALETEVAGGKLMDDIKTHISETDLDNAIDQFDFIFNNDIGHEKEVFNQIRDIIRELTLENPVPLTIFCDLDDTICHCSSFYIQICQDVVSQVRQLTGISETESKRLVDKHIMSYEKRYFTRDDFAKSLVNYAVEAFLLQGMSMECYDDFKIKVFAMGMSVFNKHYEALSEDVLKVVRKMAEIGQLVIFTLGDHTEQMKKIAYLGLLEYPIEIFTHKDENMFRYLQSKYSSRNYVMIGDSYLRDIVPANQAGIKYLVHIDRKGLSQDITLKNDTDFRYYHVAKLNDNICKFLQEIKT